MTAVFVFAALIVVNVAYCIYDGRSAEAARQIDDFYRVEFKKSYGVKDEIATQSWYCLFHENRADGFGCPLFCYMGNCSKSATYANA